MKQSVNKTQSKNSSIRVPAEMEAIRLVIEKSRRLLVVSHVDPDGDALGTQLAFGTYLTDCGKDVLLVRDSDIPQKYTFLPGIDQIQKMSTLPSDIDTAVVLECPKKARIGSAADVFGDDVAVINIDHHPDGDALGDINWVNTAASSVGEMVFEYFNYVDYRINATVAEQLYTAILTDTGRFRYTSTSRRTMEIAGMLIEAGANSKDICDNVYYSLPASTMSLTGKVLAGIEFRHDDRLCLLTLTKKMLKEAGATPDESDGLVEFTLFSRSVQVGALLKEIDNKNTKVSLRSIDGIDVSAVASIFGGGGHRNAAGCTLPFSLEDSKSRLSVRLMEVIDESQ